LRHTQGGDACAQVTPRQLEVSPEATARINQHVLLLYTGSSRLARDLLHTVVRRCARAPFCAAAVH
jgi:hypothetical protein